jgi:hypothetical protein
MVYEEDHKRGIEDYIVGDHIQGQIPDVEHEVQGHYTGETNKVP